MQEGHPVFSTKVKVYRKEKGKVKEGHLKEERGEEL